MGTGLILIAAGAILRYAVNDSIDSIDLETVGLILIAVGAVAFVIGAIYAFGRRDRVVREEVVERPVVERTPRDRL
jgi:high-affinity nickel permease